VSEELEELEELEEHHPARMKGGKVEMERKGLHRKSCLATEIERRDCEEAGVPDKASLTVGYLRSVQTERRRGTEPSCELRDRGPRSGSLRETYNCSCRSLNLLAKNPSFAKTSVIVKGTSFFVKLLHETITTKSRLQKEKTCKRTKRKESKTHGLYQATLQLSHLFRLSVPGVCPFR